MKKKIAKGFVVFGIAIMIIPIGLAVRDFAIKQSFDAYELMPEFAKDTYKSTGISSDADKFSSATNIFSSVMLYGEVNQNIQDIKARFSKHKVDVNCPGKSKDDTPYLVQRQGVGEVTICNLSYYGYDVGTIWLARASITYGPDDKTVASIKIRNL